MIRIPYVRACRTSSRWRSRPSGPLSAYPAETTTRPCTPCSPHSATTSGTCSAGTATTARSTGPVDVAAPSGGPGRRRAPSVLGEGAVDGVQAAGEAGVPDVVEDAAADAAGRAAGADDGDRARGEQSLYGARLGALLPRALDGEGAVGGLQVELQADDAVLEAALLGVARRP